MLTVSTATLDTFEDGSTLGWGEGGGSPNPPELISTGGPNGVDDGFLRNESGGNGPGSRLVMFNRAEQWTGDYVTAGVTGIQAQVANFGGEPLSLRVALATGAGNRTAWFASAEAFELPADGQWRAVTFELDADSLTVVDGTLPLADVLADVTEFRILSAQDPDFRGDVLTASLGIDAIQAAGPEFVPSWHNVANPVDVDDNGGVTPLDALLVINELNNRVITDPSTGALPPADEFSSPFFDVNDDGIVSPLDAVTVINALNAIASDTPTAAIDTGFAVVVGDTLQIDIATVLANDVDPNGDALSIQSVDQVSDRGADVSIVGNQIIYDPSASAELSGLGVNAELTDTFNYTIENSNGLTSTNQVTVRVIGEEVVRFRLQAVDGAGNPIDTVLAGSDFGLAVYVEDVRSAPTGVFSPYLDIVYDAAFATPAGTFDFSPAVTFPDIEDGKFSTPGLIDEAGAFLSFEAVDSGEVLVFTIPFTASQSTGAITFAGNPADIPELHDLALSGSGDVVPASQVIFGRETLQVVEA